MKGGDGVGLICSLFIEFGENLYFGDFVDGGNTVYERFKLRIDVEIGEIGF